MTLSFFTEAWKSDFLQKKLDFDEKKTCQIQKMMKPKMVRMVRRNILYDVDLEICDSKSE